MQGAGPSSLAAKVGAPEFVPAPPGLSSSPGNSTAVHKAPSTTNLSGLPKNASNSSLSATAVNAPVFVPGTTGGGNRPTALDAKPFVPGTGSTAQGKQTGGLKPPKGSPVRPPPRGSKQQQGGSGAALPAVPPLQLQQQHVPAQPSGRAATPDLGLPEGDDLLGLTAVTPGDSKDVAAQAAEMFRALNPYSQQQQQGGGGGSRGRGGPMQQQAQPQRSPRPNMGMRGGAQPPGGYSAPGPPAGGRGMAGTAGRGRGRGRRVGPAPNRAAATYAVAPGRMQKGGYFIGEHLRAELQQRAYLTQAQLNPETDGDLGLPEVIQQYHTLYPLEDTAAAAERLSPALGVRTQVVKAISRVDGQAYALRRIDPRQVIPTAELLASAEECVERWAGVSNHPNLVGLREAFVSGEWDNTPALFFAHDYYPGALTLEQAHIQPTHTPQGLMRVPASEEQLWSYLIQLSAALRAVHSAGLAARPAALAPSKVLLISPGGRVRLGACGVLEVLSSEGGSAGGGEGGTSALQRADLAALGHLLLVLACAGRGAAPSLDYITAHFSREFCHVVAGLLAAGEGSGFASWRSLVAALGDRVLDELGSSQSHSDMLLSELGKECENGRLLRVVCRLSAVTERPELCGDTQWSETGDRYVAKLFRDFVFHSCDEEGAPLLDWGAVAEALNKADAGVPEKILLLSRDEVSMLVVSYADVKRCIQNSYAELRARSTGSGSGGAMQRSKSKPELQRQADKGGAGSAGGYY